ncbi:Gfo/Idh/MocA family protein [Mariniluteicoccus flavus]
MDTIRWGIAGTGRIADTVATDLVTVPGTELVAVGSRDPGRAQEFAARFGGGRGLAYADLIADDEVDAIYLATPHPQHRQLAVAALRAGKAVLVEKAFTATLAGAEEVVAVARETGVFCMEAMWTRFQPAIVEIRRMVADGELGEVRRVEADLGAFREFDASDRLFDTALGGGALLDLGVYPVSFAQHFLGDPEVVHTHGSLFPNGADADFSMLLGFSGGRSAALAGGLRSDSAGRAVVVGTDGWVDVLPRFHHASRLVVHRRGEDPREVALPPTGKGYTHEIVEVNTCLREGRSESEVMPLSDTLAVMRILDEGCRQLGVTYAEDDSLL